MDYISPVSSMRFMTPLRKASSASASNEPSWADDEPRPAEEKAEPRPERPAREDSPDGKPDTVPLWAPSSSPSVSHSDLALNPERPEKGS